MIMFKTNTIRLFPSWNSAFISLWRQKQLCGEFLKASLNIIRFITYYCTLSIVKYMYMIFFLLFPLHCLSRVADNILQHARC